MGQWDNDKVLSVVETLQIPIGSLVAAFPGAAAAVINQHWMDPWFLEQAQKYLDGEPPTIPKLVSSPASASVINSLANAPAKHKVRLKSLTPNYFRGFRAAVEPINLGESLVVIEGLNSGGKTSLSEALEWVLTGALSRRSAGSPRELANCTINAFRPDGESTWVECTLELDSTAVALRRVLIQDYTEAVESTANSLLYCDGKELSPEEGRALLEVLFAGVHPILMQHTLREFVYSTPAERRRYFERLLQIDEFTALIERAVVGDARIKEFIYHKAPDGRRYLDDMKNACTTEAGQKALKGIEKARGDAAKVIPKALLEVAAVEFGIRLGDLHAVEREVERLQEVEKTRKFPVLQHLKIRSNVSLPSVRGLSAAGKKVSDAIDARLRAEKAAKKLRAADKIASSAVQELLAIGVIDADSGEASVCPMCFDDRRTLSPSRIHELLEYGPITSALHRSASTLTEAETGWKTEVASFSQALEGWKFDPTRLSGDFTDLAADTRPLAKAALATASVMTDAAETAATLVERAVALEAGNPAFQTAVSEALSLLDTQAGFHQSAVESLDRALGSKALADPQYASKAAWLNLVKHRTETASQLRWESAIKSTQGLLADIRKGLIELRSAIIEGTRQEFTTSMSRVWEFLRADAGGKFSKIGIPAPKGKGFKLEIEVKAVLNDGKVNAEVDALRVFSESQINVVGIAAYVTRAAALGHTVLVFDDPVQSMDEEHYKSLAGKLIPELVKEGRQVIVLTHSESFARDISHIHFQQSSYATLRTRYSRRKGCWVEEGSRRVAERLSAAEKLMENGQLEEGWNRVRLAVERLYTVAMKASNPAFEPDRWRYSAAEHMWEEGVEALITAKVPGSGDRLKEILKMTAKGAHDAVAQSATDLQDAISYIRMLLTPLRVGEG